jgi:carbonic anhydrase/acetyltransferase-like protein (isoleucine patch superfamily)
MLKANPIIFGDKCNIQDGVVFHCLIGCLTELYSMEIPGEKCMAAQTKLSEYMGYGHRRDPQDGAEQISN